MSDKIKKISKIALYLLLVIAIIIGFGAFGIDYILSSGNHKENVSKAIKNNYGFDLKINGPVVVKWVPQPSIVMYSINVIDGKKQAISAKKVIIPLSFSYIFGKMNDGSMSEIKLEDGLLNVDRISTIINHKTINSGEKSFEKISLNRLNIRSDKFPMMRKAVISSLSIEEKKRGVTKIRGLLNYRGMETVAEMDLVDIPNSPSHSLDEENNNEIGQQKKIKKAKFEHSTRILFKFPGADLRLEGDMGMLKDIFPLNINVLLRMDDFEMFNKYVNYILNNKERINFFPNGIEKSPLQKGNLTVSAKISLDANGDGRIYNLSSTGPIKEINGEINIASSSYGKKLFSGHLSAQEIDLINLERNKGEKNNIWLTFLKIVNNIARKFLFKPIKKMDGFLNIDVGKVFYHGGKIDEIIVRLGNVNNISLCDKFEVRVGKKSKMDLKTVIREENDTAKLSGIFELTDNAGLFLNNVFKGKKEKNKDTSPIEENKNRIEENKKEKNDSSKNSKKSLARNSLKENEENKSLLDENLFVKANIFIAPGSAIIKAKGFVGDMRFISFTNIKNTAEKNKFDHQARFNYIDFDQLNISPLLDRFLLINYISSPDGSPSSDNSGTYFKLMNNYNILRSIKSEWNIEADAGYAVFKGEKFDAFRTTANLDTGYLGVKSYLNSDNFSGNVDFSLKLKSFKPTFTIDMDMEKIDMRRLLEEFPTNQDFLNAANKDPYLRNFLYLHKNSTDKISRFSSTNYDAALKIKAKELTITDEVEIQDGEIKASLNGGVLNLEKATGSVFDGGKFDARARIILYEMMPSYYVAFNLANFIPHVPFRILTGLDKIDGYASIGGNITTSGDTKENLKKNMNGNLVFLGKNISWNGFDISEAINVVDFTGGKFKTRLAALNKAMSSGTSLFDDVSAEIKIDSGIASFVNGKLKNNRVAGTFAINYSLPYKALNSICYLYFILNNDYVNNRYIAIKAAGPIDKYVLNYDADNVVQYMKNNSERENNDPAESRVTDTLRHKIYN